MFDEMRLLSPCKLVPPSLRDTNLISYVDKGLLHQWWKTADAEAPQAPPEVLGAKNDSWHRVLHDEQS